MRKNRSTRRFLYPLVAAAASAAMAGCAQVEALKKPDAAKQIQQKQTEIPVCNRKLGSLAIEEPDGGTSWWSGYQLPAPSKLIKVFVSKSGCFTLVDRGAGMNAAMRERALASGGELRNRSNVGKGQIKAADYVLVPDLVSRNADAGGNAISGLVGGLIGGTAGRLVSNIQLNSKTADVVLTLTDVRSSEQVAMIEGHAEKTDFAFGAGGSLWGSSGGIGGAGLGGYTNTAIGQVISMAYLQAYTDLVSQLGGLPGNASKANQQQAVRVTRQTRLLARADGGGKPVRELDPGTTLYPTGTKQGAMWEVEDELGNSGWISSTQLEMAR